MARIKAKADDSSDREVSVIEKLILRCGPDSSVPVVTAFDMVVAGIDTTGEESKSNSSLPH